MCLATIGECNYYLHRSTEPVLIVLSFNWANGKHLTKLLPTFTHSMAAEAMEQGLLGPPNFSAAAGR